MRITSFVSITAASLASLALLACGDSGRSGHPVTSGDRLDWTQTAALTAAATCDSAQTAFREAALTKMELDVEQTRRCFLGDGGCYRWAEGDFAAGGDPTPAPPAADDATPDEYSETNTQVDGVDEADIVKTDGEHLYGLFGRDFVALDSWPAADTHELGRVRLHGWPNNFYLVDGKAVVLSWVSLYDFLSPEDRAAYDQGLREWDRRVWNGGTLITVLDLSGPTPVVTAEHMVGGYLVDSRRIGDALYLAQNDWISIDGLQYWPDGDLTSDSPPEVINAAFDAILAKNRAIIEALPLSWWLPRRYDVVDGTLALDDPGVPLVGCTDVLVPNAYAGQSLLSVVTYDIAADTFHASTVSGDWGTVYASKDALYVAATNWGWYWWWDGVDGQERPPITTHIHKFALGSDGVARYAASGSVLGHALDQFAFDEHGGHLRVATTDGFGWWNEGEALTESRVTVLAQQGAQLVEEGMVGGLGKGETIYAVRFMGDLGYVVTFRQVDPLYVLDLHDPAAPVVAGELKVPGFSSYIHPLDAGHLLTIGRDATDEGQVGGMKLEIFDVTDPAAPRSVKTAILGDSWNTWSDAQWDHKAFTYFGARGLLGIPVSGWETDNASYWHYKSELFVFKVSLDDIEQLGAVSHLGLLEDLGVNTSCRSWYGWDNAYIRRGVFIEDYVYSVSNVGVVVHDTRDLGAGEVASVLAIDGQELRGGYYQDPCDGGTQTDAGGGGEDGSEPAPGE